MRRRDILFRKRTENRTQKRTAFLCSHTLFCYSGRMSRAAGKP